MKGKLKNLSEHEIVHSFLDRWEFEWDETKKFTNTERKEIKSFLFSIVLERLKDDLEVSFNGTELEDAIDFAINEAKAGVYSKPIYRIKSGLDEQCSQFINYFISKQEFDTEFSNQEFDLLWGKLYVSVTKRYKDRLYTCLCIKQEELNDALDSVSQRRHKESVKAAMDRRDEEIRDKRKTFGTLGYANYYIGKL
jgi:hypothetical protein